MAFQRILFGTSKVIVEHIAESSAYSDVVKVISVNMLYFRFGTEDDDIYHGTTTFRGIHSHSVLELNEAQKSFTAIRMSPIFIRSITS